MILDLHTHRSAPYDEGIISVTPDADFTPVPGQLYSVGLHPWESASADADTILDCVRRLASSPWVVAIGECGIDPGKGAPMYRQLLLFKRQVEISEAVGKPMILHAVKAADIILGVRRDLAATRSWVIHGFRSKPAVAQMYLRAGLWLGYGERFNADALRSTPLDRILTETDDSTLPIADILAAQAEALGIPAAEYTRIIAANTESVLENHP